MIAVVSIAKNEEANIPALAEYARVLGDKWIVADTGSTDATAARAAELGAEVHCLPWEGHGPTRNKAATLCEPCDWVVMPDADEIIPEPERMRRGLEALDDGLVAAVVTWKIRGGYEYDRTLAWRPGYGKWKYRAHTQLFIDGPAARLEPLTIEHPGPVGRGISRDEYLPLLEADVADYPMDAGRHYYLGRQLYYAGRASGLAVLDRCVMLSRSGPQKAKALVYAGWLASDLGHQGLALAYFKTAAEIEPKMRGAYQGIIRVSPDRDERTQAAEKALESDKPVFWDSAPVLYGDRADEWFRSVMERKGAA